MTLSQPKSLIINRADRCPERYWQEVSGQLTEQKGRRPAGYEIFDTRNNTRRTQALELVNRIRERVDFWRDSDYPGVTSITRSLLEHWKDQAAREYPFYFCQLEAIETLIWWVEASSEHRQGIHIPGDGGDWERLCNKMATGSGKTVVMGMIIAWQALNALTYPRRERDFSRAIFVVAPGLTVKERLQVLYPGHIKNIYDEFNICPSESLRHKLNQVEILVENWHTLMPLKEVVRSVVKKGRESNEAFTRRVMGKMAASKNLVIINDEAHHAYRKPADVKISKKQAAERGIDLDEATRWIEGLDRLHGTRRIQRCFDLSATPFAPTGRTTTEEALFGWVVSDFGLNDAIEAGLVKTPRVVIRDGIIPDTKTLRPKLYHLYRDPEVHEDLNRKAEPHEALPLLVQQAFTLLGADWREYRREWLESGHASPPAMLTVCNRIETAERIEHYFASGDGHWPELHEVARLLRVDSKVLDKAEIGEASIANKDYHEHLIRIVEAAGLAPDRKESLLKLKKEELLREIVDNVGKRRTAGQNLQKIISVAMLSEGWDAKNVTHIMGLRAFTSQLLCEQVIGRGLRRVSHDRDADGFFTPEYVNVFGVPLSVFQDVDDGGEPPPPPKPSTQIESLAERSYLEIRWPNVVRVDTVIRPELRVNWEGVEPLILDPSRTPIAAELAPALGAGTSLDQVQKIDLELLPESFRLQRLTFQAARKTFHELQHGFSADPAWLITQLVKIVETFIASDRLQIPSNYHSEPLRRRILLSLNIDLIVQHLQRHLHEQNSERLEPVFDEERPIGSTRYMPTWYTTKACLPTRRSQISHCVSDGAWEAHVANILETSNHVDAYAKNERLGFHVYYLWKGSKRRYVPDFFIRMKSGKTLLLEIKGQDSPQNKQKRAALDAWVRAVNQKGGFGTWCWDVAFEMSKIQDILENHSSAIQS